MKRRAGFRRFGLATIAPALPKVMSALKVKPPEESEATKPEAVELR